MPKRYICVSNLATADPEEIRAALSRQNIQVHNVFKVTRREDATRHSYKISINVNDLDKVFDENFWSYGVRCKLWERNRKRENQYLPGENNRHEESRNDDHEDEDGFGWDNFANDYENDHE